MTNSEGLAQELGKKCTGQGGLCSRRKGGKHAPASGNVAAQAAVHPQRLCVAILRGCQRQLYNDGILLQGHHGMHPARRRNAEAENEERRHSIRLEVFYEEDFSGRSYTEFMEGQLHDTVKPAGINAEGECEAALMSVKTKYGQKTQVFRDDLTGQLLDPALVHAARRKELDYFNAKGVW